MRTVEERISILFPLLPTLFFYAKVKGKGYAVPIASLLGIWKKKGVGNSRILKGIDSNGKQYLFTFADCKNKSRIFSICQRFNSQRHISDFVFALRWIEENVPDEKKEKAVRQLLNSLANIPRNKSRAKENARRELFEQFVKESKQALKEASNEYHTEVEFIGGMI